MISLKFDLYLNNTWRQLQTLKKIENTTSCSSFCTFRNRIDWIKFGKWSLTHKCVYSYALLLVFLVKHNCNTNFKTWYKRHYIFIKSRPLKGFQKIRLCILKIPEWSEDHFQCAKYRISFCIAWGTKVLDMLWHLYLNNPFTRNLLLNQQNIFEIFLYL